MPHWKTSIFRILFCLLAPLVVFGQANQPYVTAKLESDRTEPFLNEVFHLTLSVHSAGYRLAKRFELKTMPESSILVLGEFDELPQQRSIRGGLIHEIRQYRCTARAVAKGAIDIAPVLRVGILTRKR